MTSAFSCSLDQANSGKLMELQITQVKITQQDMICISQLPTFSPNIGAAMAPRPDTCRTQVSSENSSERLEGEKSSVEDLL